MPESADSDQYKLAPKVLITGENTKVIEFQTRKKQECAVEVVSSLLAIEIIMYWLEGQECSIPYNNAQILFTHFIL